MPPKFKRAAPRRRPVRVDVPLASTSPENYGARVLPGGRMNADRCMKSEAMDFMRAFAGQQHAAGSDLHGPWLRVEAGAAKGWQVTS